MASADFGWFERVTASVDLSWVGGFWTGLTSTGSLLFIATLLLLLVPAVGRNVFRLLRPFRSVKAFGAEFILSEEGAREGREEFERYRAQVRRLLLEGLTSRV